MQTTDPLSRLAALAAQRRAKTSTLHAAVQRLLAALEPILDEGEVVKAHNGLRLNWFTRRCNGNYYGTGWNLEVGEDSCDPSEAVDSTGYYRGQFDLPYRGPSREQLVMLARLAPELITRATEQIEAEIDEVEAAAGKVV